MLRNFALAPVNPRESPEMVEALRAMKRKEIRREDFAPAEAVCGPTRQKLSRRVALEAVCQSKRDERLRSAKGKAEEFSSDGAGGRCDSVRRSNRRRDFGRPGTQLSGHGDRSEVIAAG